MYGLLYWWYLVPWSIEDSGPPPLWALPWAGLALTAFVWLWVWWLDHANQRNPKHAIVFLALLGLLVVGNGVAGAIIAWKRTSRFGLAGHTSPEAALDALFAASGLFGTDMYRQGDRLMSPDYPNDLGSAPAEQLETSPVTDDGIVPSE